MTTVKEIRNTAVRRRTYIAMAPTAPVGDTAAVAARAEADASQIAADIRDLDPREIWGQLAWWGQNDPLRLYAVTVALAAMVPVDQPAASLLAWTEGFVSGRDAA